MACSDSDRDSDEDQPAVPVPCPSAPRKKRVGRAQPEQQWVFTDDPATGLTAAQLCEAKMARVVFPAAPDVPQKEGKAWSLHQKYRSGCGGEWTWVSY